MRWILLVSFGFWMGAWAQYGVGRVLEVDPLRGLARVQVAGEVREALLPVDGGGVVPGARVVLYEEGGRLYVAEPYRLPHLAFLFLLFALGAGVLGRARGLRGLLGTLLSLLLLVFLVIPKVAQGGNPLLYAFLGSLGILLLTLYLVHGVNRKTTAALLGTLGAVGVIFLLALAFTRAMGFTGLASEEALLLRQWGEVDLLALYLAGVGVGALGALSDVTVTQAAVVQALRRANPGLGPWALYRRGMEVGYEHIGSLVNTLVLAYMASALPLFLLLTKDPTPLPFLLNSEPLAAELAAMILGSLGLLLAVPLTTFLAAWLVPPGEEGHPH